MLLPASRTTGWKRLSKQQPDFSSETTQRFASPFHRAFNAFALLLTTRGHFIDAIETDFRFCRLLTLLQVLITEGDTDNTFFFYIAQVIAALPLSFPAFFTRAQPFTCCMLRAICHLAPTLCRAA